MTIRQKLRIRVARLRVWWRQFADSQRGQRILWWLRQLLTAAVVAYLVYRLSQIGWVEIWQSLPRTPWFYIIFAGMYLILPTFQALIFGLIWSLSPLKIFPASLKKRVYNKDVLSYSGDVYLYFWARERLERPGREIMHAIKDNAIVSSVTSTLVAFGLLAAFLFSGVVAVPEIVGDNGMLYVAGTALVLGVLIAAGVRFRRNVFWLSGRLLIGISALHFVRLLAVMSLQVLEWEVVIPEVELEVWFTYLAVQIMVTRIPFLPSRDLVFLAFGIELAGAVQVSKAAIAGVLGVHSVLDKGLNLLLFSAVSAWDRRLGDGAAMPDANGASPDPETAAEAPEKPLSADSAAAGVDEN